MTGAYEAIAAGVVVGWCVYWLLLFFTPRKLAVAVSVLIGFGPFIFLPELLFYSMIIAVFAPFGLILPIVAGQGILRELGYPVKKFASIDLVIILTVYTVFISASVGVFAWDPYRYGYSPAGGGAVAALLCLYGILRQHPGVCIAAIGGQCLWMSDIGSSNYFDHVGHVLLIPIIFVCLVRRGVGRVLAKG